MTTAFKNAFRRRRQSLSGRFSEEKEVIEIRVVKGVGGFGMGFNKKGQLESVLAGGPAELSGAARLVGRKVLRITSGRTVTATADRMIALLSTFPVGGVVTFVFEALPSDRDSAVSVTELLCEQCDIPAEATPAHTEHEHHQESIFRKALASEDLYVGCTRHEGLRSLAWGGVPEVYRADVWRYLTKCVSFSSNASTPRTPNLGFSPAPSSVSVSSLAEEGVVSVSNGSFSSPRKLADYQNLVQKYWNCAIKTETHEELVHQVRIDVARMQPGVPVFRSTVMQEVCARILFLWGVRHPASGYVQGMDAVLTPFLCVFFSEQFRRDILELTATEVEDMFAKTPEADTCILLAETHAYFTFSTLLGHAQHFYTPSQPGVQAVAWKVEQIVTSADPELHDHLVEVGVDYLRDFIWRWATCFLVCICGCMSLIFLF